MPFFKQPSPVKSHSCPGNEDSGIIFKSPSTLVRNWSSPVYPEIRRLPLKLRAVAILYIWAGIELREDAFLRILHGSLCNNATRG